MGTKSISIDIKRLVQNILNGNDSPRSCTTGGNPHLLHVFPSANTGSLFTLPERRDYSRSSRSRYTIGVPTAKMLAHGDPTVFPVFSCRISRHAAIIQRQQTRTLFVLVVFEPGGKSHLIYDKMPKLTGLSLPLLSIFHIVQ